MSVTKIQKIIFTGCFFYITDSCLHAVEHTVPKEKSSLFFHKKQSPSQETLERHRVMQEQPLVFRPFINPQYSFQVGSSDASQVSPMSLTAYWQDPAELYKHTGGNREERLKGMLKLLLLVELQYVQKVPVYRLTDYERQKILQQNFYNLLNKQDVKITYGAGRRLQSGVRKFFNTKSYRAGEKLKQQQTQDFQQANADEIIIVFKSVMESLVKEFMNKPLLSLAEGGYVFGYREIITPDFIVSCAQNKLDIIDPRPLKKSPFSKLESLREVAIALNFVLLYMQNPHLKNDFRKNYNGKFADQLFKKTYGKEIQNFSEIELRGIIVRIAENFMRDTGLDKFIHALERTPADN